MATKAVKGKGKAAQEKKKDESAKPPQSPDMLFNSDNEDSVAEKEPTETTSPKTADVKKPTEKAKTPKGGKGFKPPSKASESSSQSDTKPSLPNLKPGLKKADAEKKVLSTSLPTLSRKKLTSGNQKAATKDADSESKENKDNEEESKEKELAQESEPSNDKDAEKESKVKTVKARKPLSAQKKEKPEAEPTKKTGKDTSKKGAKPKSTKKAASKRKSSDDTEKPMDDGGNETDEEGYPEDQEAAGSSDEESPDFEYIPKKKIRKSSDGTGHTTVRVALSGFDNAERSAISDIVKSLGGKITDNVTRDTTHVISKDKRTTKLLLGIAYGVWVLNASWVYACVENGGWAKENEHELDFLPGIKASRTKRESEAYGLLFGQHVYVYGETQPKSYELEQLILACDGDIAEFHDHCRFIITSESEVIPEELSGLPVVTEKFLLDSLSQGRLLALEDYRHPQWK